MSCQKPMCGPKMMCCPPPKPTCYETPMCCPEPCSLKRCRSRELRGSILYTTCDCPKRNGLSDDCRKKECFGRPRCMAKPTPCCCPSKFNYRYANVTMGKPSFPIPAQKPKKSIQNDCCPPMMCMECPPSCEEICYMSC
jgi:hypothetical protein